MIPNSDDIDWDEDSPSVRENTSTPAQQVFKNVVIPMTSRSSVGSSLSSARGQSSEYDTPATSAAATPAESLVKGSMSGFASRIPATVANGKRKRSQVDELLEADALLARSMQEQEYDEQPVGIMRKRARAASFEDSDDGSSLLFDALKENSVDVDDSEMDAPQLRRHLTAPRTALPARAARNTAKNSIRDKLTHEVIDSESSGLSDHPSDDSVFLSDLDSDVFNDSEAEVEMLNVAGPSNDVTGTNAASAPIAATPIRRRRRGAPSARVRLSRRERQLQGLGDRVCH